MTTMWEERERDSCERFGFISLIVFFGLLIGNILVKPYNNNLDFPLIISGFLGLRYGVYYKGYFSKRDEVRRNILGATFSNICIPILLAMPMFIWELRFVYILLSIAIWFLILYLAFRYGNGFTGRLYDNIYNSYHYKYSRPPFWRNKERKCYDIEEKERMEDWKKKIQECRLENQRKQNSIQ